VGRLAAHINNDPDYVRVSLFGYERDKVGNPTRITYQDANAWRCQGRRLCRRDACRLRQSCPV
jgi:hypothetical protein